METIKIFITAKGLSIKNDNSKSFIEFSKDAFIHFVGLKSAFWISKITIKIVLPKQAESFFHKYKNN